MMSSSPMNEKEADMDFFPNEWDFADGLSSDDSAPATACLEKVIVDLTDAISHDPNNTDAHVERGTAYFSEDELDLAIDDYTTAIQLNPDLAVAYYCRGLAFQEKGDRERGTEDRMRAAHLDPEFEDD